MDDDQFPMGAHNFNAPEAPHSGNPYDGRRNSSLSTVSTNGFSSFRELTSSTCPSSTVSNSHFAPPLTGNSNDASAASTVNSVATSDWMRVVMSPDVERTMSPVLNEDVEATERRNAAMSLLEFSGTETARSPQGPRGLEIEAREELAVQSPEWPTFNTRRPLDADDVNQMQASSPSTSNHVSAPALAMEKPARTPLPSSRPGTGLNLSERIEDATFSQRYSPSRNGWNAINHVPKNPLRREDDITIPFNSIIMTPGTSADLHNGRIMSAPADVPKEKSPTPILPPGSLMRAAPNPLTRRAANKTSKTSKTSRASRARKASKARAPTIASGSSGSGSSGRNAKRAKTSLKARTLTLANATDPGNDHPATSSTKAPSPVSAERREKWKGKPMAELVVEALRAATSTNHMLAMKQISAYIETYRLSTPMQLPALSQTIRAAVMNKCRRQRADGTWKPGLWEHVHDVGMRTGRYRLRPEGFAVPAAVVVDDGDDDDDEDDEAEVGM